MACNKQTNKKRQTNKGSQQLNCSIQGPVRTGSLSRVERDKPLRSAKSSRSKPWRHKPDTLRSSEWEHLATAWDIHCKTQLRLNPLISRHSTRAPNHPHPTPTPSVREASLSPSSTGDLFVFPKHGTAGGTQLQPQFDVYTGMRKLNVASFAPQTGRENKEGKATVKKVSCKPWYIRTSIFHSCLPYMQWQFTYRCSSSEIWRQVTITFCK